uniref:Alkaline phosphatase n=1 Tax=Saccoglossus kowalevskii TaxID=10224 RepID=A0ABM0LV67_SACKO|nr:PREDICTED: alkaline phosphatase-like [Saccoglossus kowalevskii]
MGVTTVTSTRIKKGQEKNETGEEYILNMDKFPHVALSKTYNTNYQVPDSAGTATAFLCGAKTKRGMIGQDDTGTRSDCEASLGSDIPSILEIAQQAGKSVGIVTTTRLTHATPASAYAHIPDRYWEADSDIPLEEQNKGCDDIALQFIQNPGIQVALGGGRSKFTPTTLDDPENPITKGDRDDGRNLIKEWLESKPEGTAEFVWNEADFDLVDPAETDFLLGLFAASHMSYENSRLDDNAGEPHIASMTNKAIKILAKNPEGFFLLVEGGRIDHAHHANVASNALYDGIAFDDAIEMAKNMTSSTDTMIVVTADHSHTNVVNGYQSRGNPILGKADKDIGADGLPYTTILYTNGPGGITVDQNYRTSGNRGDITDTDTEADVYIQQALVQQVSSEHAGEDVLIFADGPMAHLIHGIHEQHYISHVMQYAACIGNYTAACP